LCLVDAAFFSDDLIFGIAVADKARAGQVQHIGSARKAADWLLNCSTNGP
jgi:hypothetical protein